MRGLLPRQSQDICLEKVDIVAFNTYPGVAGIAFWQYFDTRTCGRECRGDSKKHVAMSWAGLFDFNRRPKRVVRTLTDWSTNKTPANLAK